MCFWGCYRFPRSCWGLVWVLLESFSALQWPCPTRQAQVNRPSAIQHPAKKNHIPWNCETLRFASCTSNWLVQMFCFRKSTKLHRMLISGLQDLLQNRSLGIALIDNDVPCFPHDNIGDNHLFDECRKLIWPVVCHMLVSISWQIQPAYWLTTEYRDDQPVPGASISRQYVSKLVTIHQCFPNLNSSCGGRPSKDWKPYVIALFSCLPIRNTVPRIFEHVFPCRRTTLKLLNVTFPILKISSVAPAEVRDSNIFFLLFNNCVILFAFTLSAS